MHVAAIRTAEPEDIDFHAMGDRKNHAFVVAVPMRRMFTLAAFRTLPGAIFLRQAMRPDKLHIARYVLVP